MPKYIIGDFVLREAPSTTAPASLYRRITLNVEILRTHGVSTGDLLTIQNEEGIVGLDLYDPADIYRR